MKTKKSQLIAWFILGFLFLSNAFIFFGKGKTGMMILFLVCSLIEFGCAIYTLIKEKNQNKDVEEGND
jgi:hypothetical protein